MSKEKNQNTQKEKKSNKIISIIFVLYLILDLSIFVITVSFVDSSIFKFKSAHSCPVPGPDGEIITSHGDTSQAKSSTNNLLVKITKNYSLTYKLALSIKDRVQPVCKPVIYLYPEQPQETTVKLDYKGDLFVTYPKYNKTNGWNVTAYPDGKIINHDDNKEYSYLFWEGHSNIDYDLSTGFVVKGKNTAKFLQNTLSKMGLTSKEYNEFIVYWLPKMQNNKYNLIHFAGKKYTDTAQLNITPKPDSMLRVFMVFKPLDEKIDIQPQKIKPFERKGFTVVEWGGTQIK